jgi:hypothetical protein
MPAGLRRAVPAATIVLLLALAVPAAAIAGSGAKCSASACKVYYEQPGPNAGEQQHPTGSNNGRPQSQISKNLSRVLSQAGKDRGALHRLLADANLGGMQGGPSSGPSALGAAFDLGTGPTILLAILVATALGLAARGSVRGWRERRSIS